MRPTFGPLVVPGRADVVSPAEVGCYTHLRHGRVVSLEWIGRHCSIALKAVIFNGDHPKHCLSKHPFRSGVAARFRLPPGFRDFAPEHHWPDDGLKPPHLLAAAMSGSARVTIGDGAMISAEALVTLTRHPARAWRMCRPAMRFQRIILDGPELNRYRWLRSGEPRTRLIQIKPSYDADQGLH